MWLFQIVSKGWEKLSKKIEVSKLDLSAELERKLSGLGIRKDQIREAIRRSNLNPKEPGGWGEDNLLTFVHELRVLAKPMLLAANKVDSPTAADNVKKLMGSGYLTVPCCAEAELALRKAAERGLIKYLPGDPTFNIVNEHELDKRRREALELIDSKVLRVWGSTGVQDSINAAFFKLLRMVVVYPVEDAEKLTDHEGRVLPDALLVPEGTTAKGFASMIHSELGEGFIYAIEARSKRRVGEGYVLKNNDVISIVSARKRA
ncbi:TPA: TGS domain-containing protein [Candidatus Bathyarchaeota archaeon]|nr:TGS domain-containing protein [Candidatus Bathyarchaeota archaeon]